jgi:hypothetical protein
MKVTLIGRGESHDRDPDPTKDPAAPAVLAGFDAAQDAGLPSIDCYRAGVEAWRHAHPIHTAGYAGSQAVAIVHAAQGQAARR